MLLFYWLTLEWNVNYHNLFKLVVRDSKRYDLSDLSRSGQTNPFGTPRPSPGSVFSGESTNPFLANVNNSPNLSLNELRSPPPTGTTANTNPFAWTFSYLILSPDTKSFAILRVNVKPDSSTFVNPKVGTLGVELFVVWLSAVFLSKL